AAQPRPAPPIARCSHRAKRRNIRRDSNRYWVTLQGQVTCSRAKKSLALVLYTSAPEAVKMQMLRNEWFDEHEILLAVPDHPIPA
ncbi:hypothetical protein ABMB68_009707, partial [Bradyrhizobium sp. RT4a]